MKKKLLIIVLCLVVILACVVLNITSHRGNKPADETVSENSEEIVEEQDTEEVEEKHLTADGVDLHDLNKLVWKVDRDDFSIFKASLESSRAAFSLNFSLTEEDEKEVYNDVLASTDSSMLCYITKPLEDGILLRLCEEGNYAKVIKEITIGTQEVQ